MITPALFWRFCLSETSCPQEDNYPNGLCIKVNGKLFPLPVRPWIPSPLSIHTWLGLCWTNICSCRVTYLQQRMAWSRRGQADPSTSPHLSASPLPCPTTFRSHGLPKLEKWEWKCQHSCGTHESQLWGFGLVTADPLHLVFQTYSLSVYLVRQLTSPLLLQRLKMKGIRNPDHSRALSNSTLHRMLISAVYQFMAK